jgi:adenylate cyclase
MRALEHLYKFTKQDLNKAIKLSEEAIELDDKSAIVFLILGTSHWLLLTSGWSKSSTESIEIAKRCAIKSIERSESYDMPHSLLGSLYLIERRYDEAVKEAEKAVELNPNGANAYAVLAFINLFKGDVNESLKLFEIALRLNPIPPSWFYHNFALALFLDGNYPKAISACEKCIVVAPNSFYPYLYKAAAYTSLDRDKDADRAVKSLLKIYPSFSIKTASKFFFRKTDDLNTLLDALRKAGIPD